MQLALLFITDILDGATDMTVTMLAGHISYIISTPILSSAFLQAGAEFQADISDISLMTGKYDIILEYMIFCFNDHYMQIIT